MSNSHPPARLLASDGSRCTVRVPVGINPPGVLWFRGRVYVWENPADDGGRWGSPMIYRETTSITLTDGALVGAEEGT